MKKIPALILIVLLFSCSSNNEPDEKWIQLFNGVDLVDWTPKFNHSELGVNYKNTFRVEDSLLVVNYEEYDSIIDEYGHLFYKERFSKYKIRVEYRFVGEQVAGGQAWANRNNGIMLHCQSPETMGIDQAFPISLEAQLLGGLNKGERPTGNLCTPGTHVNINGKLITNHCIESESETYHGDQWVLFEGVVLGDEMIHHIINGDTVISYTHPVVGGLAENAESPFPEGFALTEGYISIQAESAPTQFRKIEVLDLSGNE